MSGLNALREINLMAEQLRRQDPGRFGVKGARPGTPGYVPGGWKMAQDAARDSYHSTHMNSRTYSHKPSVASRLRGDNQQLALYKGYQKELQQLKLTYSLAGLSTVRPRKEKTYVPRASTSTRVQPIILGRGTYAPVGKRFRMDE